jgi:hypothetical protein
VRVRQPRDSWRESVVADTDRTDIEVYEQARCGVLDLAGLDDHEGSVGRIPLITAYIVERRDGSGFEGGRDALLFKGT